MSLALFEVSAQDISKYKFLAYGALPAWTGVAVDWSTTSKVYIYDPKETRGHAEFVNKKLGELLHLSSLKHWLQPQKHANIFLFCI
jgi:hypothetical protein